MVTRTDIADTIGEAFQHPPVSRSDLLATAVTTHANPHVIETLERLPEGNYSVLRDLWQHLNDVPVER